MGYETPLSSERPSAEWPAPPKKAKRGPIESSLLWRRLVQPPQEYLHLPEDVAKLVMAKLQATLGDDVAGDLASAQWACDLANWRHFAEDFHTLFPEEAAAPLQGVLTDLVAELV